MPYMHTYKHTYMRLVRTIIAAVSSGIAAFIYCPTAASLHSSIAPPPKVPTYADRVVVRNPRGREREGRREGGWGWG